MSDQPSPDAPIRSGRRSPFAAKGRPLSPGALAQVDATLGPLAKGRALLIEHLHRLQDTFSCLTADRLNALAHRLGLAQAEVYEVATFYAHFDVVGDEANAAPPAVTVRVCQSLSCALAGGERLLADLRGALGQNARVVGAPCMGRCEKAPAVLIGKRALAPAHVTAVADAVANGQTTALRPSAPGLADYRAQGGYRILDALRAGKRPVDGVISEITEAGLRGLGGAGFPTGRKWSLVRKSSGPRLMAVNADEGEPGTFKDRHCLESNPHRMLEGMLIAAWAVEAEAVYIYLRDEYPELHLLLAEELVQLEAAGLLGGVKVHLRRGAGAYICGEESAMLESIEGKRGQPRHRPPYVAEVGLFGRPTLVQNVETLFWIPDILERGAAWFRNAGGEGRRLHSYSVSGRVKNPGVKRAPAGITVRELIEQYCSGMQQGHAFKAYLPGGASGGILPASLADLPLEFGALEKHGCFLGSAAVIVLSDQDSLRAAALNLMHFFEDESCGKCTPCRVGTERAAKLMAEPRWDAALLEDLSQAMADASICGLGQAAPNPIRSVLRHFADEVSGPHPMMSPRPWSR